MHVETYNVRVGEDVVGLRADGLPTSKQRQLAMSTGQVKIMAHLFVGDAEGIVVVIVVGLQTTHSNQ
jgi:hypothetical protein